MARTRRRRTGARLQFGRLGSRGPRSSTIMFSVRSAPRLVLAIATTIIIASSTAYAGKREAMALYERGESAYNAQRFAESIELFERAYAEHPAPEFLFNIAQAHRRL